MACRYLRATCLVLAAVGWFHGDRTQTNYRASTLRSSEVTFHSHRRGPASLWSEVRCRLDKRPRGKSMESQQRIYRRTYRGRLRDLLAAIELATGHRERVWMGWHPLPSVLSRCHLDLERQVGWTSYRVPPRPPSKREEGCVRFASVWC